MTKIKKTALVVYKNISEQNVVISPLGSPVDPLVYMTTARSSGFGRTLLLLLESGPGVDKKKVAVFMIEF